MVIGKELALTYLFPEVFQGLGAGPGSLQIVKVFVEIVCCDGAVGGVKMSKE
jgi:hypothetical protein